MKKWKNRRPGIEERGLAKLRQLILIREEILGR